MYKIEYYGVNALPVVSASIHIWKWKDGWEPEFTFKKTDYTERNGVRRVVITLFMNDEYTANVMYRLIKRGCRKYSTRADVYLVQTELRMRMAEYHEMGKEGDE